MVRSSLHVANCWVSPLSWDGLQRIRCIVSTCASLPAISAHSNLLWNIHTESPMSIPPPIHLRQTLTNIWEFPHFQDQPPDVDCMNIFSYRDHRTKRTTCRVSHNTGLKAIAVTGSLNFNVTIAVHLESDSSVGCQILICCRWEIHKHRCWKHYAHRFVSRCRGKCDVWILNCPCTVPNDSSVAFFSSKGWITTWRRFFPWALATHALNILPSVTWNSLHVRSRETDNIILSSGLNEIRVTVSVCPPRGSPTSFQSLVLYNRRTACSVVVDLHAVAIRVPEWDVATDINYNAAQIRGKNKIDAKAYLIAMSKYLLNLGPKSRGCQFTFKRITSDHGVAGTLFVCEQRHM